MDSGGGVRKEYPITGGSEREARKPVLMEQVSATQNSCLTAVASPLLTPDGAVRSWLDVLKRPEKRSIVLAIGSQPHNIAPLCNLLEKDGYWVLHAGCASEALDTLHQIAVDLAILDMVLPDIAGVEFCRGLRANRRTELLPVLMMSPFQTPEHEIACITSGA